MDHVICSACREEVVPTPPKRSYWGLIVTFWAFSLLFGLGAAMTGWSVILLIAWLLMACTVGVMAQRATSYTCPECASTVTPPAGSSGGHATGGRVMTPA